MLSSKIKKNNIYPCKPQFYYIKVGFSPFSIATTSLGEERANLSAFRTFVQCALVWFCLFPLPLGVWEGLRFVIVVLPELFSYLFFFSKNKINNIIANSVELHKTHLDPHCLQKQLFWSAGMKGLMYILDGFVFHLY